MKNILLNLSAITLCIIFGSCKALDAIDGTAEMPNKMDNMLGAMDTTNGGMKKTNKGIHKQTLMLAMDGLLDKKNTEYLAVPVRMLPYGKEFAEEATAQELAELSYVWFKQIEDEGDLGLPQEKLAEFDREKEIKIVALEIIGTFTPKETINQMIEEQIYGDGHYRNATLGFLALRAHFTKNYMLDTALLDGNKIRNVGDLDEAISRAQIIEDIYELPFAREISVKLKGFSNDELDREFIIDPRSEAEKNNDPASDVAQSYVIDRDSMMDSWNRIAASAQLLSTKYDGQNSSGEPVSPRAQNNQDRFHDLLNRTLDKKSEWKK